MEGKLNGLDLFSGYGGITLGLSQWVRPIAYCEVDRYARGILLSRMSENKITRAPIWDDIRTLDGTQFKGIVDIIYGGFPCQDISTAGTGKGLGGERSGLFYEVCRLVKEINPQFVFLENVPAIRTRGLSKIVSQFTNMGYDCRWTRISAKEVGAKHLRQRWFFVAHSKRKRSQGQGQFINPSNTETDSKGQAGNVVYVREPEKWQSEPRLGRVADGVKHRVDRLKALGNGVVPLQVETAFKRLLNIE